MGRKDCLPAWRWVLKVGKLLPPEVPARTGFKPALHPPSQSVTQGVAQSLVPSARLREEVRVGQDGADILSGAQAPRDALLAKPSGVSGLILSSAA